MNLTDWMKLVGGIGMFLNGMGLLGASIEKLAGAGLERTLEKLSSNRFMGLLLGVAVTAVIQSSSATSIMVVGFVNAGIMKLIQGVTIMMGANIGTTVTGQILRLGDFASSGAASFLSPSAFAPMCIAVGAFLRLLVRRERKKQVANAIMGFGTLFVGMTMIEEGVQPMSTLPWVLSFFESLRNPVLGILVGVVIVSILQSASASVGVLQAVSATGCLTFAMAAPIVLGMNIGKFVPVLLAANGVDKKAKRAILINVITCLLGAAVVLLVMYIYQAAIGFSFWNTVVNRGPIANFNTIFNLATTVLLFPWAGKLVELSARILHDDEEVKGEKELAMLDNRFLKTPTVALEQARKVICAMAETGLENFRISTGLLNKFEDDQMAILQKNETFLDRSETALGEYIVGINSGELDTEKTRISQETALAICDFERIGDYCINIAEVASYMHEHNIEFSEAGKRELSYLFEATHAIMEMTLLAYRNTDVQTALRVEPLEETIDDLLEILKQRHTDRLEHGVCNVSRSISFMDLFGNLERISDHCSNVAVHVLQRVSEREDFDAHYERNEMHKGVSSEYQALVSCYRTMYIEPIFRIEPQY